MAQVTLEIAGRRYDVSCRNGEEARLKELAKLVDMRTADVIRAVGRGNEAREMLLAALLLADDLDEARRQRDAATRDAEMHGIAIEQIAERLEAIAGDLEQDRAPGDLEKTGATA